MLGRRFAALCLIAALAAQGAHAAYRRPDAPPSKGDPRQAERDILAPEVRETAAPAPAGESAASAAAEQSDQISFSSETGYLEFDEERNLVYGKGRSKITYGGITLQADLVMLDVSLREAQCEGGVILLNGDQELRCDSLVFNFGDGTGLARNVQGNYGVLQYKLVDRDGRPSLEQVSQEESLLRNASFTTCDFPEPLYAIQAKEVIVMNGVRAMMRSAVLKIRGVPVLYLPFFSLNLGEPMPWYFRMGSSANSGFYFRGGYVFEHYKYSPSWGNDAKNVLESFGHADVFVDFLEKRGVGSGVDYQYGFGEGAHVGRAELYYLPDDNARDVEDEDNSDRWQAHIRHRSQTPLDTYFQLNVDEVSDPEVYYDILDSFAEYERGRIPERGASGSLTLNRDDYLARVTVEVRDRIGRDRFSDFSDPNDNDLDYDVEPGVRNKDDDGIPKDRWGTTTLKAPEVNLAMNDVRLGGTNLYYRTHLNLFNSLDRGINMVDSDDDAWVQGADFYQALTWIYRFNERVTWLNRAGLGVGAAVRGDMQDDMVDGSRGFSSGGVLNPPDVFAPGDPEVIANPDLLGTPKGYYDGVFFTDPNTFHVGQSDELRSYDDLQDFFAYSDFESRLSARFTAAMEGYVRYIFRVTTDDFIGDWYASMGDRLIGNDLYDFALRTHWLEAYLGYVLVYPSISLYTKTGVNLTQDLWPNEALWYYTVGGGWLSQDNVWGAGASVTLSENQYYDPDDPRSLTTNQISWQGNFSYQDPGGLWWARIAASWFDTSEDVFDDDNTSAFEEDNSSLNISPSIGARIGPKWTSMVSTTYKSEEGQFQRFNLHLTRDLHDALLSLRWRFKRDVFNSDDEEEGNFPDSVDFSFTVEPKLPGAEMPLGPATRITLDTMTRHTALELE